MGGGAPISRALASACSRPTQTPQRALSCLLLPLAILHETTAFHSKPELRWIGYSGRLSVQTLGRGAWLRQEVQGFGLKVYVGFGVQAFALRAYNS